MCHQIVKKIALDDMKLRKYKSCELDPRSLVVPINDVNKLINYINNICKSDMGDKDKVEIIKEYIYESESKRY